MSSLVEPDIEDKRITLAEAVKKIPDGSGLFWGGFGYQRAPIALSHELVRQRKRNLTIYTCGSEVDLEIMAGDWLAGEPDLVTDLNLDSMVDFKDYAALALQWLDEQFWPEQ